MQGNSREVEINAYAQWMVQAVMNQGLLGDLGKDDVAQKLSEALKELDGYLHSYYGDDYANAFASLLDEVIRRSECFSGGSK